MEDILECFHEKCLMTFNVHIFTVAWTVWTA